MWNLSPDEQQLIREFGLSVETEEHPIVAEIKRRGYRVEQANFLPEWSDQVALDRVRLLNQDGREVAVGDGRDIQMARLRALRRALEAERNEG